MRRQEEDIAPHVAQAGSPVRVGVDEGDTAREDTVSCGDAASRGGSKKK